MCVVASRVFVFVFFFKQKTAYEMRISDWSSDVCSSDLGVDVSHRGGSPGFLGMEDGALVWPEYRGNYYFNTLGNLALDRACGLIIPDFETGDLLQMTGSAEILWPEAGGAEADGNLQVNCRGRFTPSGTVFRPRAMPGGWSLLGGAQAAGGTLPRRRGDG